MRSPPTSAGCLVLAAAAATLACDEDPARIMVAPNVKPIARIKAPASVGTNDLAKFEGTESEDRDGIITRYLWDFGDQSATATTAIAFHAYNRPGSYTVRLTITDNRDETGTATAAVMVRNLPANQPPVARIAAPARGDPNMPVTFDATASNDPDGSIVSYEWTLGSGGPSAMGMQVSHTFVNAGVYEVVLAVTDDRGARSTATHTIDVGMAPGMRPPVANAGADVNAGIGETIMFDGSGSFDPDGTIASYSWDFGDGMTATGATATHVYNIEASFPVTLTVTDDDGLMSTDTASVTIGQPVYDGNYTMVANPSTGMCGISRASFVGTTIEFKTMGAQFIGETPDPLRPGQKIVFTGTLTGASFSMTATWMDTMGGTHQMQLDGMFAGNRYTATETTVITIFMIPICTLTWNLSGDKIN